ncbi:CoA-acylating methylmalonate-semialdehyde dehydrogenase [Ruania halotolerans]|uniref:CoA-acylating methylmalonate-semialdehyde dehydrogenase n=1 Tax=Ruania halotolerans TaxID=2897773 RepID=UPI001E640872|nr:CoA-acylating methylmalonate-semialdehyde dehydrogenase [Ruania halotolerans]UFU05236.1 CoA-acylating methylmalonate-semialdehyde dehydrogenase [Ruania halotolerans]
MSTRSVEHVISGERRSTDGPAIEITDPATGGVIAVVHAAGTAELEETVAAATQAHESWSQMSLSKRSAVLFAFRHLVSTRRAELAELISAEHGKTLDDAQGEITRGLENIDFACGIGQHLQGSYADQVSTGVDVYAYREALGVVAGITPFNFPVMVPLWMAPIAIAAGNAFILKPSERDPSASLLLADLWAEAGLPAGVFSVLHGGPDLVNGILDHPGIAAVSFVGSTPIAKHVYQRASANGKRVQALGGAKNHAVIMPDADITEAADHLVAAGFGSAGQRCMAISAVVTVGTAEETAPLVKAIAERGRSVVVGPYTDARSEMGPVITPQAAERIRSIVATAESEGAEIVLDGRDLTVPGYEGGNFIGPTLVDNVPVTSTAYTEEIFGPVLVVLRAADLDEALEIVNANPYGNGAAIFTSSGGAARRFQREVQSGMVGINVPIPVPAGSFSFGGRKDSLFGDTHIYGREGLNFYTRAKAITSRWPSSAARPAASLAFPSENQS